MTDVPIFTGVTADDVEKAQRIVSEAGDDMPVLFANAISCARMQGMQQERNRIVGLVDQFRERIITGKDGGGAA